MHCCCFGPARKSVLGFSGVSVWYGVPAMLDMLVLVGYAAMSDCACLMQSLRGRGWKPS